MIANAVTFRDYSVKDRRVTLHVMTNTKEGGLDVLFAEHIKHKFCWSCNRTVIECEVKSFL